MIRENDDCVSIESAQLLKKHGFDWPVHQYCYRNHGATHMDGSDRWIVHTLPGDDKYNMNGNDVPSDMYSMPTFHDVQRWFYVNNMCCEDGGRIIDIYTDEDIKKRFETK